MPVENRPVDFLHDWVAEQIAGTRFAGSLVHLPITGSTNQVALEAAAAGARNGVWVADEQTAGRGRGGHTWHSAPGDGLYVSALVVPRIPLRFANRLPLAVGLAAQAAILKATSLHCQLRWPNDLMFDERKAGGILVESQVEGQAEPTQEAMLRFAVIGVGINLNHRGFPPQLARIATSLRIEQGRATVKVDREQVLAMLLRELDLELTALDAEVESTGQTAELLERFGALSGWASGKHVRVGADEAGNGGYTGWTRGLDRDGFLLVEDDFGTMRTVLSGGVRSA
jgi:BirA family biotin operon repressor/biotin-[acetyl-CoA-carboxylase] ligase